MPATNLVGGFPDSRSLPCGVSFTLLLLASSPASLPAAASAGAPTSPRVAAFFYPWYGTPAVDGAYVHWGQNGLTPPELVASAYYPARGVYSSADGYVLARQVREIRGAGIDELITSWWGPGSLEDQRLPGVVAAARSGRARGRRPRRAVRGQDAGDGRPRTSSSLRVLGIADFYVYGAEATPAEDWAAIADALPTDVRLFAQTGLAGFAAAGRFDGLYTYDTLVYRGTRFFRLCEQARRQGLVCAPSVGPGYDARRAVGDLRVRPRRNGRTYDAMWDAAVRARRRHGHDHELQRVARGLADRTGPHARRVPRLRGRLGALGKRRAARLPRPHGVLGP